MSFYNLLYQIVSGEQLNKLNNNKPFYKFINSNKYHNNFKYKKGLNNNILSFNPNNKCCFWWIFYF